jgi:hypothetical protein
MKLNKFIEKLNIIAEEHSDNFDVVMADNVLVVSPVLVGGLNENKKVVITDIEINN